MKQKLSLIFALILLTSVLCLPAAAVVGQSESFYVADYAGVLPPSLENDIVSANAALEEDCRGAQIVVVTINYLDSGLDSEEYADELFNSWGIGDGEENNGVLLLLVTEEKKGWLLFGSGLYRNFDADEILDSWFWDDVDDGNYETAVENTFNELEYELRRYYNAGGTSGSGTADSGSTDFGLLDVFALLIAVAFLFVIIVLPIIIITSPIRIYQRHGRFGIWPFCIGASWWVSRKKWKSMHRSTSSGTGYSHYTGSSYGYNSGSTYRSRSSSSWGSSSGSSWSSSSSGRSSGSHSYSSHSSVSRSSSSHSSGSRSGGGGRAGGGGGRR